MQEKKICNKRFVVDVMVKKNPRLGQNEMSSQINTNAFNGRTGKYRISPDLSGMKSNIKTL